MTTQPTVTRFVPTADQFAWTFGGCEPVMHVQPGDVLELFTEDAFAGRIRSSRPSLRSIEYPFINPQTGPFYVEGAEPGDTLAIHLIDVQPARDWAVSTTVPLFGALTGTKFTRRCSRPARTDVAVLGRSVGRGGHLPGARLRFSVPLPLQPSSARSASPRRRVRRERARARGVRRQHGHAGGTRRDHDLPGRQRRGRAVLDR